ncbi:uncharacterized protein N7483_004072 [Penicillium malachiteum]|uniref:uncharacterized protein n=1 Tax=Penicillium malachiteum TaxID=1324776 RepID=UPI002546B518|nr:uncharacterized protein N7483_004072 [Penicillium malachiteum]KAJ5729564.1 hypothetical protein N7483_004072 [Penicillium malachiteum]
MERVVVVGAGLYGLIAAETYLQVSGMNGEKRYESIDYDSDMNIPPCFFSADYTVNAPGCHMLIIEAGSSIGGTCQNSYGLYEFSDMSLAQAFPDEDKTRDSSFIPGWKISAYLSKWAGKQGLDYRIKLDLKVVSIRRLQSKEWSLRVDVIEIDCESRYVTIICDKLILATGLTSIPSLPNVETSQLSESTTASVIHAKEIGEWSSNNLGYDPFSNPFPHPINESSNQPASRLPKSVVVYGGANLALKFTPKDPVNVHWIIRDTEVGPAWMVPPTSTLPNGQVVASDKTASTRFFHHLSPCSYEQPKSFSARSWYSSTEGSWLAGIFHGTRFGRRFVRWFWNSVDRSLENIAKYDTDLKMKKLRPSKSVISCGASIGIANQPDLWEVIKSPNVTIYRSAIQAIADTQNQSESTDETGHSVLMSNGEKLENIDLIVYPTGYKPIVPIQFQPASLRLSLGLSSFIVEDSPEADGEKPQSPAHVLCEPAGKTHIKRMCSNREGKPEAGESGEYIPYRLFPRMVAPELVASGDRSFATVGVILSSTISVVAELQALWVAAFLTGGFDIETDQLTVPSPPGSLHLKELSKSSMDASISEDVVLGSLTGTGLEVDAIHYNDMLLRDLGLNPHRLAGWRWREMTGVYEPRAYAGIVEEWLIRREFLESSSMA